LAAAAAFSMSGTSAFHLGYFRSGRQPRSSHGRRIG
jgi:hypothetical protein